MYIKLKYLILKIIKPNKEDKNKTGLFNTALMYKNT